MCGLISEHFEHRKKYTLELMNFNKNFSYSQLCVYVCVCENNYLGFLKQWHKLLRKGDLWVCLCFLSAWHRALHLVLTRQIKIKTNDDYYNHQCCQETGT